MTIIGHDAHRLSRMPAAAALRVLASAPLRGLRSLTFVSTSVAGIGFIKTRKCVGQTPHQHINSHIGYTNMSATGTRKASLKGTTKNMDTMFSRGLKDLLEPVIKALDQDHPAEMGHEAPSRKDSGIRILLNNFCRDVYQQIYGVKTETYNFSGVKDSLDRAESSLSRIISKYEGNDDNGDARIDSGVSMMAGDVSAMRAMQFYEVTTARMEMLQTMLGDLKDLYRDTIGEDWVYVAPGTAKKPVNTGNVADRLASLKAAMRKSA